VTTARVKMIAVLEGCVKSRILLNPANFARVQCCLQYEPVRNYPKKPRWLPIAKSKMFKVRVRYAPPKLEFEEGMEIRDNYGLYHRSLWAFEANIFQEREQKSEMDAQKISEEIEVERMVKMNEIENERIRKIREEALIEEHELIKQEILQMKEQKEEEELSQLEQTETRLATTMERLKEAIPVEKLDEAIEKALAIEVDYNYAVAKDGRYLIGRENVTEVVEGPFPDKPVIKTSGAAVS